MRGIEVEVRREDGEAFRIRRFDDRGFHSASTVAAHSLIMRGSSSGGCARPPVPQRCRRMASGVVPEIFEQVCDLRDRFLDRHKSTEACRGRCRAPGIRLPHEFQKLTRPQPMSSTVYSRENTAGKIVVPHEHILRCRGISRRNAYSRIPEIAAWQTLRCGAVSARVEHALPDDS